MPHLRLSCRRLCPPSALQSPTCPSISIPYVQPYWSPRSPRSSIIPSHLPTTFIRSAATARRTAKLLRPRPAPSAAAASKYRQPARDTIVFNPPPSAPSPYYTPPLFLPPGDPRRHLLARSHAYANPYAVPAAVTRSSSSQSAASLRQPSPAPDSASTADVRAATVPLPPPVKEPRRKTYHLGEAEIAEIQRLRATDPFTWTRKRLAEKFGCTEFFVGMCVPANAERMAWHEQNLEAATNRWGVKRRRARQERRKRRELWNRDA